MKTQIRISVYFFMLIFQFKVNATENIAPEQEFLKFRKEASNYREPSPKSAIKYFKFLKQYNIKDVKYEDIIFSKAMCDLNFGELPEQQYKQAKVYFYFSQYLNDVYKYPDMSKDYLNKAIQNILDLAENEELKIKVHRFANKYLSSDDRIKQIFITNVEQKKAALEAEFGVLENKNI